MLYFPSFCCSNIRFSLCMSPKRQMWPVLSRSSWRTDELPAGSTLHHQGRRGPFSINAPMAYLFVLKKKRKKKERKKEKKKKLKKKNNSLE